VVDPGSAERWRALAWLSVATLLGMTTWFSGTAVVRVLRVEWQLTSGQTAWLTIAVQVGFVAGSLLVALTNLLDITAPRRVLIVSGIAAAACNAAFAFTASPAPAFILRFLTGVCLAGVYPTGLKLMATWFREQRGTALGIMVGALAVGSASPHLLNGLGSLPWRAVVVGTSVCSALGSLIAWLGVHEGPFPFPRAHFDPHRIGAAFREPGLRLAGLGYYGHMWELYALWGWFEVFLADSLARAGHPSRALASLGAFATIAAGFGGAWWAGTLADRRGRTVVAGGAMIVSCACCLIAGFVYGAPFPLVLALGLVWGASALADSAQFSTMVTELADPSSVGTVLTVQLAAGFLLTTATLWLIPIVREAWSWRWAFALLAPGPLLGTFAMVRLRARPEAARLAGGRG
jgi:MFS family permease